MQDIQTQALQNYQNNMAFFQKYNELVYNRLAALETLLENGKLAQKYDLVYENGYFDVVELQTGAKLYNTDSEKFSKEIAANINLKKNDQSFRSKRKINFDKEMFHKLTEANAYTSFANTAEIYDLYYNNIHDDMHMKQIDKFIFLGVGLGLHLPKIIKKFDLQIVLIVEDNLELFRLSLFTIDYKETLTGTTSYFSIADTQMEFRARFNGFYSGAFFKNQYLKFHLFSSAHEAKIQEIQAILIGRPEATYAHNRILEKSRKVLDRIKDECKFLDLRKQSDDFFSDKPWLVLGAGPSLYKNADWIKKNHDKFIIIAAFTALPTLKRIGVTPDIAVQVDENVYTTHEMIEKLGDLAFLDNTLLFFSASVSPELFSTFKKENIYLHEDRTKYKLSKSTLTVSSVGDTIHALALIYNTSEIYLLGIDLALGEDGKSHSPDHFKSRVIENTTEGSTEDFHLADTIIPIKGNFRETVNSTPLFTLSIPVINQFTQLYKSPNQTIYNLSDGCYFEGTTPLMVKDIQEKRDLYKQKLRDEIRNYFDNLSETQLDQKEIDGLYCRKGQLLDYHNSIEKFINTSHANPSLFLSSFITLVTDMMHHECPFELRDIMTIYYMNTASYIDDFFNTKELEQTKKFTKKFKKVLSKNIEKIVKTYEEDLESIKISQARA